MRSMLAMICAVLLLAATAIAQPPPGQLERGASESLVAFKSLVTARQNYKEMGFESMAELDRMVPGVPMQVFMVPLDRLQGYQNGMAPEPLLVDTKHALYPILVDAQARSSVMMSEVQGSWKAVSFGSPKMIRMLSAARASVASGAGIPLSSVFLIEVPALNLYLLGYQAAGVTMAAGVKEDGSTTPIRPVSAVFADLVPLAKAHDGLPR
jgi:hypothetical protein